MCLTAVLRESLIQAHPLKLDLCESQHDGLGTIVFRPQGSPTRVELWRAASAAPQSDSFSACDTSQERYTRNDAWSTVHFASRSGSGSWAMPGTREVAICPGPLSTISGL